MNCVLFKKCMCVNNGYHRISVEHCNSIDHKYIMTMIILIQNTQQQIDLTHLDKIAISLPFIPTQLRPHSLPLPMFLIIKMPIVSVGIPSVEARLAHGIAFASNNVLGFATGAFGVEAKIVNGGVGTGFAGIVEGDEDASVPEFGDGLFGC